MELESKLEKAEAKYKKELESRVTEERGSVQGGAREERS